MIQCIFIECLLILKVFRRDDTKKDGSNFFIRTVFSLITYLMNSFMRMYFFVHPYLNPLRNFQELYHH